VVMVRLWRHEWAVGDAVSPITPKIARFAPICAMEDIGTKDDWKAGQRVFILSSVPKGMGVSTDPLSAFCIQHSAFA
jgi:hypothetical protein